MFALCCLSLAVQQMKSFAGTTKVIFPVTLSYFLSAPLLFALLTVLITLVATVKIPHCTFTIY